MIDQLQDLVNGDPALVRRGRWTNADMLLEIGDEGHLVEIRAGRIEAIRPVEIRVSAWDFAIRATAEAWEKFWQPLPPPRHHDLIALIREGKMRFEGDIDLLMANLLYLKLVLEAPRRLPRPPEAGAVTGVEVEPVTGRYMKLQIHGRPHRLYWEEAGSGIPLLCLHTAGADGRQFRALMNAPAVTERFRVIAFDMPWHGKSSPPEGWQGEEYQLTTDSYVDLVMSVSAALGLDRPVVMGCSIGGRVVLELARRHPDQFRAAIGLQSSAFVQRYFDLAYLHKPQVHGGEVCAAYCYGLVGPGAPAKERWETLWHYMQGGPGVFKGDLHFYSIDGDVSASLGEIDTRRCPLYLLTGEYDYSCTPAATRETAARIPGAEVTIMDGLGHFPMSEDPEPFLGYLAPVLDRIR